MAEAAEGNSVDEKGDHFAEATSDPIGRLGIVLLKDYINNGFDQRKLEDAPRLERTEKESNLSAEELETCKTIGLQLQQIGDAIQQDEVLQRQISCLSNSIPKIETIMTVANVIFGDTKNLSWGRIGALFYFALEMCVRAVKYLSREGLLLWIKELVKEVAFFIVQHFADWISRQGGWNNILTYYGTPSMTWVTVLAISAITGIYLLCVYSRK